MNALRVTLAAVLIGLFSNMNAMASPIERSEKNIVQIAVEAGNFKTLAVALRAANLVNALSAPGSLTVFAPTDSAFEKLPAGTIEYLLSNIDQLTKILTYHVVEGEKNPKTLILEKQLKTLEGSEVNISLRSDMKLMINNSVVTVKPIYASNGVIYVIDTVLIP
ncbi:MAG: fasciclin domain-containing protein [Bdellovibrionales bacterium]|nr:fasciclin domain-containing protein [Bdellovibrionales bacterium]